MIRTRFAPSPTGLLHLGSVRTALFSWAYARHHGGEALLRIEDTDRERSTPESIRAILDGLAWCGLHFDGPLVYQTDRMARYRAVIEQLLAQGRAYRCYCSPAELEALRAAQEARGDKPRYDRRWRPAPGKTRPPPPAGVAPVIRFCNPEHGTVCWEDAVKGTIEIANAELDDLIIARSDGTPTYNFCVVVDDWDMQITHVIRGDDHVNNTPRQINLLRALDAPVPVYGHLPLIFNADGSKMSKRRDPVSVVDYQKQGILPEAFLNYLARLGWSHGDEECFTLAQFIAWFDLAQVSPAPARFDRDKLLWLNQQHLKTADPTRLARLIEPHLLQALSLGREQEASSPSSRESDTQLPSASVSAVSALAESPVAKRLAAGPALADVVALLRERVHTLVELADAARYFYQPVAADPAVRAQHLTEESCLRLQRLAGVLEKQEGWDATRLAATLKTFVAEEKVKFPQVAMPLRVALCGTPHTSAIEQVLALLGRKTVLVRLAALSGDALSS